MRKSKIVKNNFKKYRKFIGLTQVELSEELDISLNTLTRIENKFLLPSYMIRKKICIYFDISQNQMWEEDKNE